MSWVFMFVIIFTTCFVTTVVFSVYLFLLPSNNLWWSRKWWTTRTFAITVTKKHKFLHCFCWSSLLVYLFNDALSTLWQMKLIVASFSSSYPIQLQCCRLLCALVAASQDLVVEGATRARQPNSGSNSTRPPYFISRFSLSRARKCYPLLLRRSGAGWIAGGWRWRWRRWESGGSAAVCVRRSLRILSSKMALRLPPPCSSPLFLD